MALSTPHLFFSLFAPVILLHDIQYFYVYWMPPSLNRELLDEINFLFFLVVGLEFRAYTLSHSTSPFFVMIFFPDRVS
jgi:hypothetical protein